MNKRPGVTLVEVLTAIFIMGVGMLALLTLFPLGALSMARAIRDDRAAAAAGNAAALATAFDLRNNGTVVNAITTAPKVTGDATTYSAPDPDGPGYPVYVDPVYRTLGSQQLGNKAATTPGLSRVGAPWATTAARMALYFSLQDEIQFDPNGAASLSTGNVNRPGTYTWAYLVRRPVSKSAALTELMVVVYSGRSTEVVDGETVFDGAGTALGTQGTNTVTITYAAGSKPNIRKAGWILDTTYLTSTIGGTTYGTVAAQPYRVANVTESGATSLTLELDTNLKNDCKTLVIMENVIAVVDKGTTWKP
jgi:prepilin-type N-terminal cleavage/methylation domain-containing protein